jgi:hypothetical protein
MQSDITLAKAGVQDPLKRLDSCRSLPRTRYGAGMTDPGIILEQDFAKKFTRIKANALNKMTSPPPLPSPLEGEGWVGGGNRLEEYQRKDK